MERTTNGSSRPGNPSSPEPRGTQTNAAGIESVSRRNARKRRRERIRWPDDWYDLGGGD